MFFFKRGLNHLPFSRWNLEFERGGRGILGLGNLVLGAEEIRRFADGVQIQSFGSVSRLK